MFLRGASDICGNLTFVGVSLCNHCKYWRTTPLVSGLPFLQFPEAIFHHLVLFLPTGTMVAQVSATDPDGPDESITFLLTAGARDNFIINTTSGEIQVAKGASLDRDITPQFEVSVPLRLYGVWCSFFSSLLVPFLSSSLFLSSPLLSLPLLSSPFLSYIYFFFREFLYTS